MTPLQAVIVEILRARGFDVEEQDGHLLARKEDSEAVFCVTRRAEQKDIDTFLARYADFPGRKVLVTVDPLPPSLLDGLERTVTIWGRQDMERELDLMEGGADGHGPVDELLATDFPRLLSADDMDILRDRSVGERIVRPVITADEAVDMTGNAVAGFRQELRLMPYYVFGYVCPLYHRDERVGVESGTLSVNGRTQRVEPWPEVRELVYSMEEPHQRLEAVIAEDVAAEVAKRELVRIYTVDREHVVEEEHVTLTEKRRTAPREERIELEHLGMFFVPLWYVEGAHGTVVVDASTGRVVSEDHCSF
ncbi:hypothetical protein AOA80_01765 [Methanomassiliicoccales archaeon RumEn M1]|jgi:hypothetical protein|nr:hypothetical protein AOA80_01765 [Methanomassiliicoccales archaeon RumEn M1]